MPGGLLTCRETLAFWHARQLYAQLLTSLLIEGHTNFLDTILTEERILGYDKVNTPKAVSYHLGTQSNKKPIFMTENVIKICWRA